MGAELLFYPTAIGSEPYDADLDTSRMWRRAMQGPCGQQLYARDRQQPYRDRGGIRHFTGTVLSPMSGVIL